MIIVYLDRNLIMSDSESEVTSFDFNNIPKVNPGMFVSGW